MYEAVFLMGGLGLIVGIGLAVASKIFYVYVDPKILAVDDLLPGANCGGCGLPGCASNAEAIVAGKAAPNSCVAGGSELAEAIAELLGLTVAAVEPDIARSGCYYGVSDADLKFQYDGLSDCRAAALLGGGMKVCRIGCLGLGTCVKACPFGAISMGPDGLPVVHEGRCTGCGTCERVCPKHIINLSSVTRRILREYTVEECTTPCQRACPAGINIREYIQHIADGDHNRAVQVIKERNPFPAVIGRVCPRPCEQECRRQYVDEPVAINYLKRFAADFERAGGNRVLPYKAPDTGRQVAVIGGGVQGLSAAFFSARLGHTVTVYEATDKLGGLLNSAIAFNRLPREILEWDIQGIREMGVTTHTQMTLGKQLDINTLLEAGVDAVFLATGGWDSRLTRGISDAETPLPQLYLAIDWLKAARGKAARCTRDVVVVGNSPAAYQAAQVCFEKGARNITLLSRNPQPTEGLPEGMDEAGIQTVFGAAVQRIFGAGNRMNEIEYIDVDSGETHRIAAGTLILEAGRFPELVITRIEADSENESERITDGANEFIGKSAGPVQWEAMGPYKKPSDFQETGLFSAGDPKTDFSAAIKAIAAGRRAAASIHQMMNGIFSILPENVISDDCRVQNVDHVTRVKVVPRQIMPISRPQELAAGMEIEKGFSPQMARAEAARCLRCGLVCYEHSEESATVTKTASGVS